MDSYVNDKNVTFYCDALRPSTSHGYFVGGDPIEFPFPRLLLQVTLINTLTSIFHLLLLPFKLPTFVAQMLGAIAFGPAVIGRNKNFSLKMFPQVGSMVLNVYQFLGFMLYYFLVGVRTDVTMIKYSGKLAFIIGFTTFFFPIIITSSVAFIMGSSIEMGRQFQTSLPIIASIESTTSFHVVSALLADLKLLNSELGRLALSSSIISDLLGLIHVIVIIYVRESSKVMSRQAVVETNLCRLSLFVVIVFVFRPIMLWMIRQTPEGKSLKEAHVCAIFVMVMACSFFGEVTGVDFLLGPLILGLAVPVGPPVGTSLIDKLGCFVSVVLVPCYIIHISVKLNLLLVGFRSFLIVVFIIIVATLTKLFAIVAPSLYFNLPFVDAVALGLIMNCKGLFDIQTYDRALHFKLVNEASFGIMVFMALLQTATFTPLARALYDPSRRYVAYKRRTIQHSKRNAELRILACVHQQEDVPSMINLLEITNPTKESPIGLYVLDLVELKGRSSPIFITHQFDKPPSKHTRTDHIINAFRKFELQTLSTVAVQCFTAIAPYATIHDDICTLALEKSTSMVIIPFQPSDSCLSISARARAVNKNVLETAPCSVGILISSPGIIMSSTTSTTVSCNIRVHVCIIFLFGPDDREALAYAARMAEHPAVNLTVLRIHRVHEEEYTNNCDLIERGLDMNAINDIKMKVYDNKRIVYKEQGVNDVAGTARAIGSLGNDFSLILVGRRHDEESPILKGMAEWCEIKELGVIGDLLISADYNKGEASVLVVQQQASVVEEMVDSPRFMSKHISKQLNQTASLAHKAQNNVSWQTSIRNH